LLPTASLTNATFTANQVINVAGGPEANRNDGLSGISAGPTTAVAMVPTQLPGTGDSTGGRVRVVSAAGNDVFVGNEDVLRVDL
jgi:hypothetical protein